jgi:hypothetical protein
MNNFFDRLFSKSKVDNATKELREIVDKAITANRISVKSCDNLWTSVANYKKVRRANVK